MNAATTPDTYRTQAQATKARRRYPTTEQREAFAVLMTRDGRSKLTPAQCKALAGHPYLTVSQRASFLEMVQESE